MFSPSRLILARKRRALTKKALAEHVELQPRSISAFENGEFEPSTDTLEKIARRLKFPVSFFFGDDLECPTPENASFRAMSKMTAGKRDAALGAGAIAFMLNDWIENRFTLPNIDILDLRNEEPEAAAEMLRQHWGLGQLPVRNMIHLLESKGVRIFSLAENTVDIDAFSLWKDNTPFVFLNTLKSSEHSRFDAAHELGHLVLHRHGSPSGQNAEQQANEFASAFLMPKGDVLSCPFSKVLTLKTLIQIKKRWVVSLGALVYRLHKLNILSDWHYRTLCIEIAEKGYRRSEPEGAQKETSKILELIFSELRSEGITKEYIANNLTIDVDEIERLVFGLAMISLTGDSQNSSAKKNKMELRLIK